MIRKITIKPLIVSLLFAGIGAALPAAAAMLRAMEISQPMRAVQVDLDYVYDNDPAQTERNIELLVERIAAIRPSAVFLQAFADPKGTGLASALYFPNDQLPMRADLFARVVRELQDRAHVKVFGWLPVLSFELGDRATLVHAWSPSTNEVTIDPKAYRRVSPFDTASRARIAAIYADMAKAAPIDGLLFHDDGVLSDFEDATPAALNAYKAHGLPPSIAAIRANPDLMRKWTDFKTDALIAYTKRIAVAVRREHPMVLTARNIYAPVILDPESRTWFAQDYDKFLAAYDYVAVEAMPRMEKIADSDSPDWLQKLVNAGAARREGLRHTIFELQAVDWNLAAEGKDRAISEETLGGQMQLLARQGAQNFAYYPDDFVTDTPKAELLLKDFSLQNDATP